MEPRMINKRGNIEIRKLLRFCLKDQASSWTVVRRGDWLQEGARDKLFQWLASQQNPSHYFLIEWKKNPIQSPLQIHSENQTFSYPQFLWFFFNTWSLTWSLFSSPSWSRFSQWVSVWAEGRAHGWDQVFSQQPSLAIVSGFLFFVYAFI